MLSKEFRDTVLDKGSRDLAGVFKSLRRDTADLVQERKTTPGMYSNSSMQIDRLVDNILSRTLISHDHNLISRMCSTQPLKLPHPDPSPGIR